MEQGDPLTYINKLNIHADAVIVNQCGRESCRDAELKDGMVIIDGKP